VDRPRPLVLVAEDDPDLRQVLGDLLRRRTGARVRTVESGPAALLSAREEPPAAVVLDAGLPGLDGFEVARRLRSDADLRWTVLVGLSGAGRLSGEVVAAAGFDAFLDKRGGLGALVDLLRDLLAAQGFAVDERPEWRSSRLAGASGVGSAGQAGDQSRCGQPV
jgi:CheY-like chemotaxis protein